MILLMKGGIKIFFRNKEFVESILWVNIFFLASANIVSFVLLCKNLASPLHWDLCFSMRGERWCMLYCGGRRHVRAQGHQLPSLLRTYLQCMEALPISSSSRSWPSQLPREISVPEPPTALAKSENEAFGGHLFKGLLVWDTLHLYFYNASCTLFCSSAALSPMFAVCLRVAWTSFNCCLSGQA